MAVSILDLMYIDTVARILLLLAGFQLVAGTGPYKACKDYGGLADMTGYRQKADFLSILVGLRWSQGSALVPGRVFVEEASKTKALTGDAMQGFDGIKVTDVDRRYLPKYALCQRAVPGPRCPAGYYPGLKQGSCFIFDHINKIFSEALTACRKRNGNIAMMKDLSDLYDILAGTTLTRLRNDDVYDYFYLNGMNKKWADGTSVDNISNKDGGVCVLSKFSLKHGHSDGLRLATVECHKMREHVCKAKAASFITDSEEGSGSHAIYRMSLDYVSSGLMRRFLFRTQEVCQAISAILHLLFLIHFILLAFDSLHCYVFVTGVVSRPLVPLLVVAVVATVVPLFAVIVTSAVAFEQYPSDFTCWINFDSNMGFNITIQISMIFGLGLILSDASCSHPVIEMPLVRKLKLANMRINVRWLVILNLASYGHWLLGSMTLHYQNIALYSFAFVANIVTGILYIKRNLSTSKRLRKLVAKHARRGGEKVKQILKALEKLNLTNSMKMMGSVHAGEMVAKRAL